MSSQFFSHSRKNEFIVRKLRFIKTVLVFGLLTGFTHQVLAEGTKYELAYVQADTTTRGADFEPKALLYKHIIPYNDNIELEGIVALGITEEKVIRQSSFANNYTQKLTLSNLLGVLIKYSGALEPSVHAYVHAGLVRLEYDISTPGLAGGADGSQDDIGLAYGVGFKFHFLERGAFVVELNQLPEVDTKNETFKTSILTLGYQMSFD